MRQRTDRKIQETRKGGEVNLFSKKKKGVRKRESCSRGMPSDGRVPEIDQAGRSVLVALPHLTRGRFGQEGQRSTLKGSPETALEPSTKTEVTAHA